MSTKMLSAPARTRSLLPSLSLSPPQPIFRRLNHLLHRRNNHHTPIKMSAIVEHVVLFKVKPDVDSSKVAAMVNGLNGLTSLDLTVHLSAGQLLRSRSSALTFTHILHSRYKSKEDLRTYGGHPEHVRVVTENIKPIIDDIMAVDWISNSAVSPIKPGSAMRVSFLKLKENLGENEKNEVLDVIGGIKNEFKSIQELSVGENFSHDRAKGFTIASIAVLPAPADLEALDSNANAELVNLQKQKVKDHIEGVVVVDYVVPPPQTANL
uniref:stress-response A/B barrel domain-containing protein UP3 n=1 Tax=Erigeron canadensis TaxID=72917 RepID=UPI001CB8A62A|nr:stress-response A/B barrel domain-containing protein UP3 [Erigeron canadensis]